MAPIVDQIRSLRLANPFRPFTIHYQTGKSFRVPRRSWIFQTPGGDTIFVADGRGAAHILSASWITRVALMIGKSSHRRRR